MSYEKNMKSIARKVVFAFVIGCLFCTMILGFAACDKNRNQVEPNKNPGGNGGTNPPIEQVQESVENILEMYDVIEPTVMEIAQNYAKSGEKLLNAKLNAAGDLEMLFESGNNICAKTADLPNDAKALLSEGWEEYVLDKLGVSSTSEVIVGQDKIDAFKQKVENAIADYESAVEGLSSAKTTQNTFTGSSYDDKGALANLVSDQLLAYKYASAREDESFVIFGVDKSGNLIEYLVQFSELGGGDVYKRFANGVAGVDYTLTRRVLDASGSYTQPAVREIVTFDELYTSVFGKDFVFKPYKELMKELAMARVNDKTLKTIATGFVDNKFMIYLQTERQNGNKNLLCMEYKNDSETIKDEIQRYQELCIAVNDDLYGWLKSFGQKYIKNSINYENLEEDCNKYKTTIESMQQLNLQATNFRANNILMSTSDEIDEIDFGEQYLKVAGKTEAQLISTYVGAVSPHRIYTSTFDTGYVSFFDLSVMYVENDELKVYNSQVVVPWYNNSDNESLYNSFLNNVAFKLGAETTTVVEEANLLVDVPAETAKEIDFQDFEQDFYIDEDKRLAI